MTWVLLERRLKKRPARRGIGLSPAQQNQLDFQLIYQVKITRSINQLDGEAWGGGVIKSLKRFFVCPL